MDEVIDELKQNKQFRQGLQPIQAREDRGDTQVNSSESPSARHRGGDTPRTLTEDQPISADEPGPRKGLQTPAEIASRRQEHGEQTGVSTTSTADREGLAQEALHAPTTAAVPEAPALEPQVNVSFFLDQSSCLEKLLHTPHGNHKPGAVVPP